MARRIRVPLSRLPRFLDRLERRLQNMQPLLRQIGAMMAGRAQKAFEEQRLGDVRWPERYPGQDEPFINVAGALEKLNRDRPILNKNRLFERRPALIDTGLLRNSISFRAKGDRVVEWGTVQPYAAAHQFGKETRQRVTGTARKRLASELKKARRQGSGRLEALKKLGFLFRVKELRTQVSRRPFVGLTEIDLQDIRELAEEHAAGLETLERETG